MRQIVGGLLIAINSLVGCGGDDPLSSKSLAGFYDLQEVHIDLGYGRTDVRTQGDGSPGADANGYISLKKDGTFRLLVGYSGLNGGTWGSEGNFEASGMLLNLRSTRGEFSATLHADNREIRLQTLLGTQSVVCFFVKTIDL